MRPSGFVIQLAGEQFRSDVDAICQHAEVIYSSFSEYDRTVVDKLQSSAFSSACPWNLGPSRLVIGAALIAQCRSLWVALRTEPLNAPESARLTNAFKRTSRAASEYLGLAGIVGLIEREAKSMYSSGLPLVEPRDVLGTLSESTRAVFKIRSLFLAFDAALSAGLEEPDALALADARSQLAYLGVDDLLNPADTYQELTVAEVFIARIYLAVRILSSDVPPAMRSFLRNAADDLAGHGG